VAGKRYRIGVLALQGAFREHIKALQSLGAEAFEVRRVSELQDIDGLVIPGGESTRESTTIRMLMDEFQLTSELRKRIAEGLPVLGTCAGMIVLAKQVDGKPSDSLSALDIDVRRNAFGRQVDSFETDLPVPVLGSDPFHAVFIRAPWVESANPEVEVLARLEDGTVVGVQEGSVIGIAFHPELSEDPRFHEYFLRLLAAREPIPSPQA
jgi:pyridoxal 5'-phosphate synthase pdxT subunit